MIYSESIPSGPNTHSTNRQNSSRILHPNIALHSVAESSISLIGLVAPESTQGKEFILSSEVTLTCLDVESSSISASFHLVLERASCLNFFPRCCVSYHQLETQLSPLLLYNNIIKKAANGDVRFPALLLLAASSLQTPPMSPDL